MLHYVTGDATKPTVPNKKIIAHIVNDIGAWGAGFVMAISDRWMHVEHNYRIWAGKSNRMSSIVKDFPPFKLGEVLFVPAEEDIEVANMCAQHGLRSSRHDIPLRYDALRTCMEKVADQATKEWASVHMPRIGCGLAGGSWPEVEAIILDTLFDNGLDVYVYDLP